MKKYYLGIDQGTTGTTALLFNRRWELSGYGYKELKLKYPQPGWVEHDPMEILQSVYDSINMALKDAKAQLDEIICLGHANQGESVVLWNKDTGLPIYNVIVWQDKRTSGLADQIKAQFGDSIREKTGLFVDSYFSATKIKWILDHVEGAASMAKEGKLLAGTLDSWVVWNLTREHVHATDCSTASRTMLFNIHTGQWDEEILDLFGIPKTILPEIRDNAKLYGYTDPNLFSGARIPITASIVDQQAALLGQACFTPGSVKTTYGTGCFMLMNTGEKPVYSKNGLLTTLAWKTGGKPVFALDGGIYVAGEAIRWLRDKMQLFQTASETETMAISAISNGGVYFVPAFAGLAAPYWDQYARGTMLGITGGTTKEQIVRATLESIAYQVKDVLDVMNLEAKMPINVIRADGGMVSNRFLMQFQADILGIRIEVPTVFETTALGAACLAAYGFGAYGSLEELKSCWKLAGCFEPNIGEDERQSLLFYWHRAVKRAKGWLSDGDS